MDMTFFNRIAKSNASTICRNDIRDFVVENPEYLKDLVAIGWILSCRKGSFEKNKPPNLKFEICCFFGI